MKRGPLRWLLFVAISLCTLTSAGCLYRYHNAACKQREATLAARSEALRRNAYEKLKIGTKKDDVIRFFAENNIPVVFDEIQNVASGTISVVGCAPSGCGSDAAILGVTVKVDKTGTVISEPVVGGIYTNCL